MSFPLRGTDRKAVSINAAIHFNAEVDRQMLKLLIEGMPDSVKSRIEKQAAEKVLASGLFEPIRAEQ